MPDSIDNSCRIKRTQTRFQTSALTETCWARGVEPKQREKGDRIPPAWGEKVGGAVVSVRGRQEQEEEEVVSSSYEVSPR